MTSTSNLFSSPIASSPCTSVSRRSGSSSVASWSACERPQPSNDGRLPSPLAFLSNLSPDVVTHRNIDARERLIEPAAAATPALRSPIELASPMVPATPLRAVVDTFEEGPPPYSESRYPRTEGLIGLGFHFAADLSLPAVTSQRTGGLSHFLTYEPPRPQASQPVSHTQGDSSEAYTRDSSTRSVQDNDRRVRSRLHSPETEPANLPAQPALASPTFAFSFSFPEATLRATITHNGQTSARSGWGVTSSATMTYQPWPNQDIRQPGPMHSADEVVAQGLIVPPLTLEATRWLNSTWHPLELAGFTQEQCFTLAQRLGPDARAKVMWNLHALTRSGYTSAELVHMLVQPGANNWLTTLARVLPRLYGHRLSAADVATILQAPHADDLLRAYEPGSSRQ